MIKPGAFDFPLRHLSIRVPWHDAGWAGVVCQSPQLNGACVKLKGIAAAEKDKEQTVAGRCLDELPREQWPCCLDERSAFMAPFELELTKRHQMDFVIRAHHIPRMIHRNHAVPYPIIFIIAFHPQRSGD